VKAWWSYWLTLVVGVVLWIGIAVVAGREGIRTALGQPISAAILLAPIFLAGLNAAGKSLDRLRYDTLGEYRNRA
jgi:hypothetical protein